MLPAALVLAALVVVLAGPLPVRGFYLPGVAPSEWKDGEFIPVNVGALTSTTTHLPMDYYKYKFCRPKDGPQEYGETLGEVLLGSRFESTDYKLQMGVGVNCAVLCQAELSKKDLADMRQLVEDEYMVNMVVDNLPGAMERPVKGGDAVYFGRGYFVGRKDPSTSVYAVNNHVVLKLWYHVPATVTQAIGLGDDWGGVGVAPQEGQNQDQDPDQGGPKRIVRFEVLPLTVKHTVDPSGPFDPTKVIGCQAAADGGSFSEAHLNAEHPHILPDPDAAETASASASSASGVAHRIIFSYSVEWHESTTTWATRWDMYLSMGGEDDSDIHWISISNSLLIVVFLSVLVALILVRALRKDLLRYNRVPTDEEKAEELEEVGWKLVHGDVFRAPSLPILFATLVGTGMQCFFMVSTTIVFAALGFLSPANRGSLMTALLVLFVLSSSFGGFFSARIYKTFNGAGYQRTTLLTAFALPGIIFATAFLINFFVWGAGSSAAIPFTTMVLVALLWFVVSVPLCFAGAFLGYRLDPISHPVRTAEIPRQIPTGEWYMHWFPTFLVAGILPFGTVSIELYFILSSVWNSLYYYVFGFLLIVAILTFIIVSEMAITLTYFSLCAENYHWWWRAFLNSGSSAVYVFLYTVYYYLEEAESEYAASAAVFFGYSFLTCLVLFVLLGSLGFISTYIFTRVIYGAIKVD